jgi:hypothetical protein
VRASGTGERQPDRGRDPGVIEDGTEPGVCPGVVESEDRGRDPGVIKEKEGARWRRWSSKPVWGSSGPRRVRLPPFSATPPAFGSVTGGSGASRLRTTRYTARSRHDSLPSPPLSSDRAGVRDPSLARCPHVATTRDDSGGLEQSNGAFRGLGAQVHVTLSGCDVRVPGQRLNPPCRCPTHRQA